MVTCMAPTQWLGGGGADEHCRIRRNNRCGVSLSFVEAAKQIVAGTDEGVADAGRQIPGGDRRAQMNPVAGPHYPRLPGLDPS